MATIITKFSDYVIQSIEYVIDMLETELAYRDLPGLTNNKIEKIAITKQHPLASLMAASLQDNVKADSLRASLIPAIAVTPGSPTDMGFNLANSYTPEVIDSAWITNLRSYQSKTLREIQADVLITQKQIDLILAAYRKAAAGGLKLQKNQFSKNEEINISVWSDTPDVDILLGNLMDSILAGMQTGMIGDDSPFRNLQYKMTKGLTNFNFGRVLFGTEYSLTFFNIFYHYIVFTDDVISGHDLNGTFTTPGV